MRIGIFGGSFDPVHTEHKALCLAAIESLSLDKLFVVPAGVPPHKKDKKLASAEDRFAMCALAFADVPQAEISDFELKGEGTSYTYLTIGYFRKKFPQAELFLLVGTDMYLDFFSWKEPEAILKEATLAVCRRNEGEEAISDRQAEFFRRFGFRFLPVPYNGKPVSSTEIRVRVALGSETGEMLFPPVAEYIQKKGLYRVDCVTEGLSLEKPSRAEHSRRVCLFAVRNAKRFGIPQEKAFLAGALHDAAKNLPLGDERLKGFFMQEEIPMPVLHQYTGAYLLEHYFHIEDEDVLSAVRYHTSGRPGMSDLEKLIFLSDMLEEERGFPGVEELRQSFQSGLDECMYLCLKHQIDYLKEQRTPIYPLTFRAYEYYKNKMRSEV